VKEVAFLSVLLEGLGISETKLLDCEPRDFAVQRRVYLRRASVENKMFLSVYEFLMQLVKVGEVE